MHARELFAFVMRFVANQEAAEDLLHDVFVKLMKYSEKEHVTDSNIRALLYQISRTVCLDYLRSSAHTKVTAVSDDYISSFPDSRGEGDEIEELRAAIRDIVSSMGEPAKSVFIMKNDRGLTFEEVAAALDTSVRTAKRRMNDAMNYMAGELRKRGLGW
jgi:RNA polymerase sigma-70 factor (ECF subfamily)